MIPDKQDQRLNKPKSKHQQKATIGWREWIHLPDLGGAIVKAKIDSGARTSAIHAWNIKTIEKDGRTLATFDLHPFQDDNKRIVQCEAFIVDRRAIRSSTGHAQDRLIIHTAAQMGIHVWKIELSLTRRDEMGFRMLLGRTGIRGRFLIDPGKSFLMGKP